MKYFSHAFSGLGLGLLTCILSGTLILNVGCTNTSSNSATTSGVGNSAKDLLTATPYTSLVIEIQPVTGYTPTVGAQNALVTFLNNYLRKSGGITVHVDAPIASPGKTSYSLADVQAIEAANRTLRSSGTQAVAYFLFLDGASTSDSGSSQILGQAYGATSLVIYQKTIQNLSGSIGQPSRQVLETTVMEHEFGHILGLVNVGTPLQSAHQDSPHGAHCTNTSCLMFWQVDTSDFLGNLLGGTVPSLDANCIADLHANGGL